MARVRANQKAASPSGRVPCRGSRWAGPRRRWRSGPRRRGAAARRRGRTARGPCRCRDAPRPSWGVVLLAAHSNKHGMRVQWTHAPPSSGRPHSRRRHRARGDRRGPARPRRGGRADRVGRAAGRAWPRSSRARRRAARRDARRRSAATSVALKGPCTTPIGEGFTSVNVALRKKLNLYAAVRPVRNLPGVHDALRATSTSSIVRENTEGLYSGHRERDHPGRRDQH